jgi:hypothetical protein
MLLKIFSYIVVSEVLFAYAMNQRSLFNKIQNSLLNNNLKAFKKFASVAIITSSLLTSSQVAISDSRLNAPSAAGTRVNSDPESLLRYGLPIDSKNIR